MRLKPEASIRGIRPETVLSIAIVDSTYVRLLGHELTVTEVTGGVHKSGSLHYVGLAFDGHTKDVKIDLSILLAAIKEALAGMEFDAILEDEGTANEHLHVEFQPKH